MTTATQLNGTRFGSIDFTEEDVVLFRDGMIGFPNLSKFVLLSHKPESPFRWLQSIDEPAMAFLVVDPFRYISGYAPDIADADARALSLDADTPHLLLTTAAIPGGNADKMTMNLAAPILINMETRQGKQVVLDTDRFSVRHYAFVQTQAA